MSPISTKKDTSVLKPTAKLPTEAKGLRENFTERRGQPMLTQNSTFHLPAVKKNNLISPSTIKISNNIRYVNQLRF